MFCPNCGSKINYGEKFCSKCGALTEKFFSFKKGLSLKAKNLISIGSVLFIAVMIVVVFFLFRVLPSKRAVFDKDSETVETAKENENEIYSPEVNDKTNSSGFDDEVSIEAEQIEKEPWEYIIGDYSGVQIREEDNAIFLKRINIVDDYGNIRIDSYSQDEGVLEDKPNSIVYIPKDDIEIVNSKINIDFEYTVDYRPDENKIGYFDMYITIDLNNPNILKGVDYYTADLLNGRFINYIFKFELEKS